MRERLREVAEHPTRPPGRTPPRSGRGRSAARAAARTAPAPRRAGRSARGRRRTRTSTAGRRPRPAAARRPRRSPRRPRTGRSARPGSSARPIASTVPATRSSSAGRKPTSGISRRLASSRFEPYDWTNAPSSRVEAVRADVGVDLVADPPPPVDRPLATERPRRPDRPVEGHPRHHLRVGEVPARAARPPRCPRRAPARPPRGTRAGSRRARQAWSDASSPCVRAVVEGVDDLAVDVELELLGGGVADPHRRRALVAGQPVGPRTRRAAARRRPRT